MPYVINNEIIDTTCEICLDSITKSDMCILNCNHCFHTKCIITTTLLFPTCSVCRIPIITVRNIHFIIINDIHLNPVEIGSIIYKNKYNEQAEIDKVYYQLVILHSLSNPMDDTDFHLYTLKKIILKYHINIDKNINDYFIVKMIHGIHTAFKQNVYNYHGKLIIACLNDFTYVEHCTQHQLILFLHLLFKQFNITIQQSILEFLKSTITTVNIQLQWYIQQYINQIVKY